MNILIMLRFESKIKATRLKIKDTTLQIYCHGYVKYYNIVQNLKTNYLGVPMIIQGSVWLVSIEIENTINFGKKSLDLNLINFS